MNAPTSRSETLGAKSSQLAKYPSFVASLWAEAVPKEQKGLASILPDFDSKNPQKYDMKMILNDLSITAVLKEGECKQREPRITRKNG